MVPRFHRQYLPSVQVAGETIDGLLILAEGLELDGPEAVLASRGPTILRGKDAGTQAFLPAKGEMTFDVQTWKLCNAKARWKTSSLMRWGMSWALKPFGSRKRMIVAATSDDPTFRGKQARAAYGALLGKRPTAVPIENLGGRGTRNSHWRESIFGNELMSGFVRVRPQSAQHRYHR